MNLSDSNVGGELNSIARLLVHLNDIPFQSYYVLSITIIRYHLLLFTIIHYHFSQEHPATSRLMP